MMKVGFVSLGLLFSSVGATAAELPRTSGCLIAELVQRNAEPVQVQLDRVTMAERALRLAVLSEIEGWSGPDTLRRVNSEVFLKMQHNAEMLASQRMHLEIMLGDIVSRECAGLATLKREGGA